MIGSLKKIAQMFKGVNVSRLSKRDRDITDELHRCGLLKCENDILHATWVYFPEYGWITKDKWLGRETS
ncbi:MAG: hypothetical protein DWQ19_08750 [Crenarchaeota archaeon]|nr:MAG: hypothetical protein DWQ19_08750 [Thermoproteota archaeon]